MHDSSKLTGPEWDALQNDVARAMSPETRTAMEKIAEHFVSEEWYRCHECGGWLGPIMREEEQPVACSECGGTGIINTYGDEATFHNWF